MNSWPDAGMTPFRSEKNTNWEGAYRVPLLVRWPGKIPGGRRRQRNRPASRLAADVPRHGRRARHRREAQEGAQGRRQDLQGPSRRLQPPALPDRRRRESPRKGFVYFNDDGDIVALRFDNWKVVFLEQRVEGTMRIWAEPFVQLRVPKVFNLRTDPLRARRHHVQQLLRVVPPPRLHRAGGVEILVPFLESFKEFPPRQKPGSFSLDQALQRMKEVASGAGH